MRIQLKPFNIILPRVPGRNRRKEIHFPSRDRRDNKIRISLRRFLLVLLATAGCESMGKKKEVSTLHFHLEVTPDGTDTNAPVPIYRAAPIFVNVQKQPFLNEGSIVKASVVDVMGGFAIFVQFDRQGTWLLEQYSVANRGRRIAIMSQFGEVRWLAAPVMTKPITDGTLVFTPDATHEEADRIVRGLTNVTKELQGKEQWHDQ